MTANFLKVHLSLCSRFSFVTVLTVVSKVNALRISRDLSGKI